MSTPVLTPLDTPIFDDDVIADMETRYDGEVACEHPWGCELHAVMLIRMRCCGASHMFCLLHGLHTVEEMRFYLRASIEPYCVHCNRIFRRCTPLEQVARVVMPI